MHRGWALLAILLGCSSSAGPRDSKPRASKKSSANPMAIDETPADFKDNPRLLSRLLSGPHGYFRFVNIKFATEVCRRFDKDLIGSPAVNLHGDAHVEQYAVTDLGRGLTDFDDASRGPAIVDLTRFGVSILLAAEANGWAKHGPRLIGRFLDGYRDALADPKLAPPIPAVAARFLGSFREDRQAALVAADDLMDDLDFAVEELQSAIDRYAKPLGDSDLNLRGSFFKIKRAGKLHIGIGSALDSKYLLRVEGPSTSPDDDVVLEVKEVRKLNAIPCLNSNWTNDPFRILVGSARIAYRPFRYLGYTVLSGQAYWVHAWTDNYFQVQADRSFQSVKELDGLVYDTGVQLGRGHPYLVATPLDTQLRQALLAQLDRLRGKLEREIVVLAELTKQAWISFSIVVTSKR